MMGSWRPIPLCHRTHRAGNQFSRQPKTVLPGCCLQNTRVGMGEGDMEIVNIYDLTMLQHVWVQGGRCQKTIRLKQGFPSRTRFSPTQNSRGERGSAPANHHTLHRSPKPLTHSKTVCCSEHSGGKTAHSYSGGQKSD